MLEKNRVLDSRRQFIRFVASAAAAIPLLSVTGCSDKSSTSSQTAPPERAPQTAKPPGNAEISNTRPPPVTTADPVPAGASINLPRLSETDPTAAALGYQHDASMVDTGKYPRRAGAEGAKQLCHNCALFLGQEGQEWAGCTLFPGKAVNRNGWCNGWAPKA